MRHNPYARLLQSLLLISADIIMVALVSAAFAGQPANGTERTSDFSCAIVFAAHLAPRGIGISGLAAAVNPRLDSLWGEIGHDLIAQFMPRHGQYSGSRGIGQQWRCNTLTPQLGLAE